MVGPSIKDLTVIAAHCDDEVLGAGGLIARMRDEGVPVRVIIFSDCLVTARGYRQDNSPGLVDSLQALGEGISYKRLNKQDQYFDKESIADMANDLRAEFDPIGTGADLVVTHSSNDLNRDHRIVSEVVKVLLRPIGSHCNLMEMEIPNSDAWNGQVFHPNLYIELKEPIFERKKDAMARYENEMTAFPKQMNFDVVERLARFRGMEAGYDLAEAFRIVRWTI